MVCLFGVLCPSFEVACHILETQGIRHNRDRVRELSRALARPSQAVSRYMGYLEKNKERMLYAQFREQKLVCGSGVIESGIRRVINLRFKNAPAFWLPENVEGLYSLRGILLAFRWNIWINNLVQD
jgi:hypothetical protein